MSFLRSFGVFEYLCICLSVLLYAAFWWRTYQAGRATGGRSRKVLIKTLLRTLYVGLFWTAMLAPSFGDTKREVKAIGKDLYFLLDLSASMDATDIQPSRLNRIKFELKNIIRRFGSDRKGLIIFTDDAFLQCPLTFDNSAFELFVDMVSTRTISGGGTDFAPALRIALDKFEAEKEGNSKPLKASSKILILISDGEDFGEETSSIASDIRKAGIRVFTLGVGTRQGSKIPDGPRFKRNDQNEEVISKLNDTALRELSNLTDGQYFEVSESQNDVERLIYAISRIEGEMRDSRSIDASANKYLFFLLPAVLLMILDMLWTVRIVRI